MLIKGTTVCPKIVLISFLLTHIVEAIGFSSFGTHERHICPFAIAVGVAFNQVIRRFSVPYPVTQELTDAASMDHSIAKSNPRVERYELAQPSFTKWRKCPKTRLPTHTRSRWPPSSCELLGVVRPWVEGQGCM